MPTYKAPLRDFQFVLKEWLDIEQYKDSLKGFDDLSIMDPILDEAAKFCEGVLFPLNQSGDAEGLTFDKGNVHLPKGFKEAYQAYVAAGWPSFTCDPAYGGQGLPEVLNMPITEMISSSNLSFGLLPGLSHGAYNAIHIWGTEEQKKTYLPKLVTGEWSGVMCLTEPQAGTDLGLIRTKATPNGDGSYNITGTKIFISEGEQDATENIVHLILAKLPDAPAGSRGISLFVTAKFLPTAEGKPGERNKITCGAIEHKMGIHASPTCVMNFDGAKAWLVGEPHKGLKAMFTMMNEARIYVGIQGLGLGEVSYQNALAYAKERLQMRSLKGAKYPDKPADPLVVHPDIRRMLLTMRAFCEGSRVLALWSALKVDTHKRHSDPKVRQEADDFVQLMTPIVKSYLTDGGSEITNLGMQVLGGYGYIREYGMEQYVRDARIAQIYEGTNGVQALDLIGRKLPAHMGRYLRTFFHPVDQFLTENRDIPEMAEFNKPLYQAVGSLQNASIWMAQKGLGNPDDPASGSVEYQRMFSLVVLGYIWARTAKIALAKVKTSDEKNFYETKLATARFYMNKILPEHFSLLAKLTAGVKSLEMPDITV
ncbi:MAG: acyl-CoA dehydrogenase [Proteobacteria bacterium]|nr:acyl-CoA dehydrogenase [Pseudomonadota bacterium]